MGCFAEKRLMDKFGCHVGDGVNVDPVNGQSIPEDRKDQQPCSSAFPL
jgi:hypothetical protein